MTADDRDNNDDSQQDDTSTTEGRRWGIWLPLATLVLAMVLSALISLIAPRLAEMLPGLLPGQRDAQPSPLEQEMAAASTRLDRLEAKVLENHERAQAAAVEQTAMQQQMATLRPELAGIGRLAERLSALGQRVDEAEAQIQAQAQAAQISAATESTESTESTENSDQATAALDTRLQELEATLAERGGENDRQDRENAALKQQLATLESRVAAVRTQLAALAKQRSELGSGGNGALLALALGRLRDGVGNGPFADQLAALVKLIPEPTAASGLPEILAELEKRAAGVDSRSDLARQFAALAGPAVRAGANRDGGWLEATRRRLSGLVSLRRTGEPAGNGIEARVARAEAGLARDDLAAALAEVSALVEIGGGAAEILAPWHRAAGDRLAVEQALTALESRLPELLQATGSP